MKTVMERSKVTVTIVEKGDKKKKNPSQKEGPIGCLSYITLFLITFAIVFVINYFCVLSHYGFSHYFELKVIGETDGVWYGGLFLGCFLGGAICFARLVTEAHDEWWNGLSDEEKKKWIRDVDDGSAF